MPNPSPRRAAHRWRGAAAAVVATLLALAGHLSGGGAAPHVVGVLVAAGTAGVCGSVMALVGSSRLQVAGAVAVAQAILHTCFVVATPSEPSAARGHGAHVGHGATSVGLAARSAPAGGDDHWTMWSAHLVAALLTLALFSRGEAAVRHLLTVLALVTRGARALDRHLLGWLVPPGPATVRPRPPSGRYAPPPQAPSVGIFPAVRPLRGPPAVMGDVIAVRGL